MPDRKFGFDTLCLHAGQIPDAATGARALPIYQTTSFVFDSADHAASLFNLQTFGNVYSRISNPTVAALEERVAALEGGRAALAAATGMAAQTVALLTLCRAGDHLVASRTLYGGTYSQFAVTFAQFGIDVTFVDGGEPENFRSALRDNTKALYTETFGDFGFTMKARMETMRPLGPTLSPLAAFLLLQGIETLHLRMPRHCESALAIARHLAAHPRIEWVNYPLLPGNRSEALARKYLPRGAGGILTFGVKGGAAAGVTFIESVQMLSHLANVGDAKTLVIHPASTTHRQLNEDEQRAAGVLPEMIRLSVGLESLSDILWDIDQALERSQR